MIPIKRQIVKIVNYLTVQIDFALNISVTDKIREIISVIIYH